jgi:RNA polymerase sigma-70 factor (ECF subfamily)
MAALEGLLAEDVISYSDGGGLVRAAAVPVSGRERVKAFVEAVSTYFWKGVSVAFVEVNGQAAVLVSRGGVPATLGTIDASGQGIDQIMWFLRPSKLGAVSMSGQNLSEGHAPGPAAA